MAPAIKDRYMAFSRSIHYMPNRRVFICYRCHVPVHSESLHPQYDPALGRLSCEFYDVILPYLFALIDENQVTSQEIFARYGLGSRQEWIEWLGLSDVPSPWASNVARCFVEEFESRDARLLRLLDREAENGSRRLLAQ